RPSAQAASVVVKPRSSRSGTSATTTAETVNAERVRAAASVQNGRLRATVSAPPVVWAGAGGALGQGALSAKAWAGMVTAASTRARTAYVARQDRWAA